MRILFAEDKFTSSRAIQSVLKKAGLTSDLACSGQNAIELLRNYDYGLAIISLHLADLELLIMRKGIAQTKETFLNHLYGGRDEPDIKIIDVFICKLRKKLQGVGAGDMISTVWGKGYILHDPQVRKPVAASAPTVAPVPVRHVPDMALLPALAMQEHALAQQHLRRQAVGE